MKVALITSLVIASTAIFAAILHGSGVVGAFAPPPKYSTVCNTSTVVSAASTNIWISNSGSNTAAEAIFPARNNRIRQTGLLRRVGIKIKSTTGLTAMYFKVWRKSGTTYNLVGTSENVVASLPAADAFGYIDLSSPIWGVQEGDSIGYRVEWSSGASAFNFYSTSSGGLNSYYVFNTTPTATAYDWESQSSTTNYHPLVIQFAQPYFAAIGDSLISGRPGFASYLETFDANSVTSSICYQLSQLLDGHPPYQNMGIASQTTAQIASRIQTDLVDVNPVKYAILQGGINDIGSSVDESVFLASWTTMLRAARNQGSIPICLLMFPATSRTRMDVRDIWNADLTTLVAAYPPAIVVDVSSRIGVNRPSGPDGNLWDINPLYDCGDGLHLNSAGYAQVAAAIYAAGVR